MSQDFSNAWKATKASITKLTDQVDKDGKLYATQDMLTLKSLIDVFVDRPSAPAPASSSNSKRGAKKMLNGTDLVPAFDPAVMMLLQDTVQAHAVLYGIQPPAAAVHHPATEPMLAKRPARTAPKRKFKFTAKELAAQAPASPFSSGSENGDENLTLAFRYKAEGKVTGVDSAALSAYWQPYTEDELRVIDLACIGVENGEEKQTHAIRRIAAELGRSENGVTTKLRDRLNYHRLYKHIDPEKRPYGNELPDGRKPRGRPRKNFGLYAAGLEPEEAEDSDGGDVVEAAISSSSAAASKKASAAASARPPHPAASVAATVNSAAFLEALDVATAPPRASRKAAKI